jgi:hypothetical protein
MIGLCILLPQDGDGGPRAVYPKITYDFNELLGMPRDALLGHASLDGIEDEPHGLFGLDMYRPDTKPNRLATLLRKYMSYADGDLSEEQIRGPCVLYHDPTKDLQPRDVNWTKIQEFIKTRSAKTKLSG